MKLTRQNVFLIDGIGALISAIFLGLVLPLFSNFIQVEKTLLYSLAAAPLLFAFYSLTCHFKLKAFKPHFLFIIILANSLYSLLTISIVLFHNKMNIFGKSYFVGELLVLFSLIFLEFRVYSKKSKV